VHAGSAVAVAATFVWLGMVVAISFVEAPLKFRAPGVTLAVGLAIGRLVFRALNASEALLAAVVIAGLVTGRSADAAWPAGVAVAALVTQVLLVRPALTRRSDQVLAGRDGPRSHAHFGYIGLEVVKVIALAVAGVVLLGGST
jgi:hypothetical protein